MLLPKLGLLMTTYFPPGEAGNVRLEAAKQTIMSWRRHIHYEGPIQLHIADDGSSYDCSVLENFSPWPTTFSKHEHNGLGASLNAGCRYLYSGGFPVILSADDSFQLVADLDLTPWVWLLNMPESSIGAIFLHPSGQPLFGGAEIASGFAGASTAGLSVIQFERVGWVYRGRPALWHQRLFDYYGPFSEGVSGNQVERDFCDKYNADPDGPAIVYAMFNPWLHVYNVEMGGWIPGQ